MELNDHENYALSIFQTLTNNNICKERLVDYIEATEEELENTEKINWFKIAIKLDNKRLVDAIISHKNIKENQIDEAILFGSNLNNERRVNIKEIVISLNLPDKNPCLTTLDYVRERKQYASYAH